MDIQQNVISAIVVAIVAAAIPGAVALWQSRDKARLDERASYYSAIRADVDELRGRLDALEGYVSELEDHVATLHALMASAGLQPPPKPKRPRAQK